jgi:small subunit ribosomal protein S13e
MGRIQSKGKGKGISSAVTPFKRRSARWVAHTPKSISDLIVTMAKKGMSPSQIGVAIRDREAVPSIKLLTGQKIVRLLKKNGSAPEIPEDIYCLIKKAVNIRRHLEKCRKDKDAKYRIILIESRIHRLARYYRRTLRLPNKWKYNAKTASALVSA